MKQASVCAFSALDLRQTTFYAAPFVAAEEQQQRRQQQKKNTTRAAPFDGNKSRARSCYGQIVPASSSSKPNPSGRQLEVGATENTCHQSKLKSERQIDPNDSESFECRPSFEQHQKSLNHHREEIKSFDDNDRSKFQQLNNRPQSNTETTNQEQPVEMSQTIQSIQSLSMQLNRAASLSASLDDTMSVSQEMSGRVANSRAGFAGGKKLTKLVGKKAGRMKEILLQNLGKAHKTTDELFEMYEENFYKQQAQAVRIQKEFKNYMTSLKGEF